MKLYFQIDLLHFHVSTLTFYSHGHPIGLGTIQGRDRSEQIRPETTIFVETQLDADHHLETTNNFMIERGIFSSKL